MDVAYPAIIMTKRSATSFRFIVTTSTGFAALRLYEGQLKIISADANVRHVIPTSKVIAIWSCANGHPEAVAGGITMLDCSRNRITNIDLLGLTSLESLNCSTNLLTKIWFSGPRVVASPSSLISLNCSKNKLAALDVSCLTRLKFLDCSQNHLKSLDLGEIGRAHV